MSVSPSPAANTDDHGGNPWGGEVLQSLIRNHPAGENKSPGTGRTLNGFWGFGVGMLASLLVVCENKRRCETSVNEPVLQGDLGNCCRGRDEITDRVAGASRAAVFSFRNLLLSQCGTLQTQYCWNCGTVMLLVSCCLHGNCSSAVACTYSHFHADAVLLSSPV